VHRDPETEGYSDRLGARSSSAVVILALSALALATLPARLPADGPVTTPAGYRAVVQHVMLPGGVVEEFDEYLDRDGRRVKHGVFMRYYRNGDMREMTTYAHGVEEGPFQVWQDGNVPLLIGRFAQGKLDGNVTRYYPSGRKQREFTYRAGALEGPFVVYHDNGVVQAVGSHKAGKRQGSYAEYHPNAQLRLEGSYLNGFLNGAVVLYSESGGALAKGKLARERVRGPWLCLAASGKPEKTRRDCEGKVFWECACD